MIYLQINKDRFLGLTIFNKKILSIDSKHNKILLTDNYKILLVNSEEDKLDSLLYLRFTDELLKTIVLTYPEFKRLIIKENQNENN